MTISDFVTQNSGKLLDFDGEYGAQCVDEVQYYAQSLGLPRFWGNAVDIADQASAGATWLVNTPTNYPQPGDIVVWKASVPGITGQFGHVAIAVDANPNSFNSFDQNWPTGTACHVQHHTYTGVAGWLHPLVLDAGFTPLIGVATTGTAGCRVRADHTTQSPDNQGTGNMRGGVSFNITGWAHGETVAGNDIWYRTLRGNWVWSGGTAEGTSLVGGIGGGNVVTSEALEVVAPEPTPAPDPVPASVAPITPVAQPVTTSTPDIKPVSGTATLATNGYVYDLTTDKPVASVPSGTVITVAGTTVHNGAVYLVTRNMVDQGLNEGIPSTYFVRRVDSLGAKPAPVTLAQVPQGWHPILRLLHLLHLK